MHVVSDPSQMRAFIHGLEKEREAVRSQEKAAQEGLAKAKREAEKYASKLKLATSGSSSQREAELQREINKCWVCSSGFRLRLPMMTDLLVPITEAHQVLDVQYTS
jgi:hypothetical protein